MQAVILAGGQGTRLLPLTLHTPKPLLPIAGRPLLSYLLRHLKSQGVDEIFITGGYLGHALEDFVRRDGTSSPVHVVREATVRGTAGAVADLAPRLRSPFLVVSGDAVLAIDVKALAAAHQRAGGPATLGVMAPVEQLRFGIVDVADGRVRRFVEKPRLDELVPGLWVNSGVYLLDREALAGVAAQGPVDFARDVFPGLKAAGHPLGAAAALRFWRDVGTAESFRDAHFEALTGKWPWPAPPPGAPAVTGAQVVIEGPVAFGEDVVVGPGTRITGPAYIGSGVRLGPRTEVTRSVLLAGSRTAGSCSVQDAVVDSGVLVPGGLAVRGAIVGQTREAHGGRQPLGRRARRVPARSAGGALLAGLDRVATPAGVG